MSRRTRAPTAPSVDLGQVERLADLSRLSLGPQEAARMRGELSSILSYFTTLDKLEVSETPASPPDTQQDGALREDVVRPSTPDEILRGVPQRKGRYVRAPRVF